MPKYEIIFSGTGTVIVTAESEEEAEEMFMNGEVDFEFADGATIIDITPVSESEGEAS